MQEWDDKHVKAEKENRKRENSAGAAIYASKLCRNVDIQPFSGTDSYILKLYGLEWSGAAYTEDNYRTFCRDTKL